METSEVSIHEVKVFRALQANKDKWLSNEDLADIIDGVAPRTVRSKTSKFVKLQLVEEAAVFPSHRFKWSDRADSRNQGYVLRLESAAGVLGL